MHVCYPPVCTCCECVYVYTCDSSWLLCWPLVAHSVRHDFCFACQWRRRVRYDMITLWHTVFVDSVLLRILSNRVNENDSSPCKIILYRHFSPYSDSILLCFKCTNKWIHTSSRLSVKCNEKRWQINIPVGSMWLNQGLSVVCWNVHLLGNLVYLTGTLSTYNTD